MSVTSALFAAGGIENIWKVGIAIVAFFAFVGLMITLGVAAWKDAILMLLGLFVTVSAIALVVMGRLNPQWGIGLLIFGVFLTVVGQGTGLTAKEVFETFGLGPDIILMFTPALVVVPNSIKKISKEVRNICGNN